MKKSFAAAINKGAGFTLIELLVVIAIIGLLSSVILVASNQARMRGRDGKRIADLNQLSKALELFFDDYKGYPTVVAGGTVLTTTDVIGLVPKYLSQMPSAPIPADGSCAATTALGSNNYWYEGNSAGATYSTRYTITFCLGAGQGGALGAGVHYLAGGAFH